ncbi:hypothetical protein D3C76_1194400 [compost metagenome]
MQVGDVPVQAIGELIQALGAVLREQRVLDAVETGEVFGRHAFFVVIDPGVNGGVQVAEQFGDRLDRLVVDASRGVEFFRGRQVAFFHRVGELPSVTGQFIQLLGDVDLVVGNRLHQLQRRRCRE